MVEAPLARVDELHAQPERAELARHLFQLEAAGAVGAVDVQRVLRGRRAVDEAAEARDQGGEVRRLAERAVLVERHDGRVQLGGGHDADVGHRDAERGCAGRARRREARAGRAGVDADDDARPERRAVGSGRRRGGGGVRGEHARERVGDGGVRGGLRELRGVVLPFWQQHLAVWLHQLDAVVRVDVVRRRDHHAARGACGARARRDEQAAAEDGRVQEGRVAAEAGGAVARRKAVGLGVRRRGGEHGRAVHVGGHPCVRGYGGPARDALLGCETTTRRSKGGSGSGSRRGAAGGGGGGLGGAAQRRGGPSSGGGGQDRARSSLWAYRYVLGGRGLLVPGQPCSKTVQREAAERPLDLCMSRGVSTFLSCCF